MSAPTDPMKPPIPTNMKAYSVVFLTPGPHYKQLSDMTAESNLALHAAHLSHIRTLIESGLLVMAVPILTTNSPILAMGVFRQGTTPDEEFSAISVDPAVVAGRFLFGFHTAFFPSLDGVKVVY